MPRRPLVLLNGDCEGLCYVCCAPCMAGKGLAYKGGVRVGLGQSKAGCRVGLG